jgi:hypothetical protein
LDPAQRPVTLSPGESDDFPNLADGDIIEGLNVRRSDDGTGYWISPSKRVNIQDLITDADPRLHGETLSEWFAKNSAVIEDFLSRRYESDVNTDNGWDEVDLECSARFPEGFLSERQIVDTAWNATKVVQLHNESDHGSFGSENLGRLLVERVAGSTVLDDPYVVRAAGLRITESELTDIIDDNYRQRPVPDTAAVAIAKELNEVRNSRGVVAYPAVGRLATRGYVDTAEVDLELLRAATDNQQTFYPNRRLARRIESMRTWLRERSLNG